MNKLLKTITPVFRIVLIFLSVYSLNAQQLKSIVYDFDGLDINQTNLPEGDYRTNDLVYHIAANPLGANDMLGDRVLKLNLNWNTGFGTFGRGISRFIEFDPNLDKFNFYFYNPLSNNQNATFDILITDDDDQSNNYDYSKDDAWIKSLTIPGASGWQLISVPLSDFIDSNPGGNGIFDMTFTQNKGMLLLVEFKFSRSSSDLSNPVFYIDMINFSDGNLPTGATIFDLPEKSPSDYCNLGAYTSQRKGEANLIPEHIESMFPAVEGKKLKYVNYFLQWAMDGTTVAKELPQNDVQLLINNGYMPVITWEPMFQGYSRLDSRQPRLNNIINGDYNSYIDAFANKIKTYSDTVIIRFMHEFEGNWYSWSIIHNNQDPARYVTAFRTVVDRFRALGVTNVQWMWCVNSDYYPYQAYNWIVPAYPGDNYVDIIATDIYNSHYPEELPWWKSFRWQATESYYYLSKYFPQKPLFICEQSCRERLSIENTSSQSKGEWFAQMDKELQSDFHKVRALIFFNALHDLDWRLNSSAGSISSLTNNIWYDDYYFKTLPSEFIVSITSPENNSVVIEGASITIQANVLGGTNGIQKVEFFADTAKLGEDITSPYSFTWSDIPQGNYELTAKAIDNENNTAVSTIITMPVSPLVPCTFTGLISQEIWYAISGTSVSDIPVTAEPDAYGQLSIFKSISNSGDNYGQRLRGYICPPATGNYIFWIASDDNSELWLSTDHNVANKKKIASVTGWTASEEWMKYPTQQSVSQYLVKDQKYYIEALHKEGGQGDNLAVGWKLPDGVFERPVPGIRLSPYAIPLTATITSPLNNSSFGVGTSVTIQANVIGGTGTIQKVEFFADTAKLGEDLTSPYSFTWNNVSEGNYQLSAKATDSDNDNAVSSNITIYVSPLISCSATGTILQEIWNNVSGTSVNAIPLNTAPGSTVQLSVFKSASNIGDNYGQRISGYVCPPVTGNYIFWIASDDNSELWLSTNDNPANKQKIASVTGWTFSEEWTKYPTQQSASQYLVKDQKYYIEVLHKEGGQGDNCAVGWQLPDGVFERPIPGARLSPFASPLTATIVLPENNSSFIEGADITIQANVSGGTGSIQKVEFFSGLTKLGEDTTSPYSFIWNDVDLGSYELTAKVTDSLNTTVSNIITIHVNSNSTCIAKGTITREVWSNISGTSVSAIPLSSSPSLTGELTIFEVPTKFADNYGQRISGFICPPVTGNYTFWIASDDNSELWLSTDENPSNRQKIASVSGYTSSRQWTKYPSQKSALKNLIAGKNYYIEALHKDGSQSDNCAVGWQLPDGAFERPIPGNRLSPFEFIPPIPTVELISAGSSWKYLDNGSNQGTAWREATFNDTAWKTGNAELGYGDGGEATVVSYGTSSTNKYITTYFRKTFNVTDKSTVSGLELSLIRDDGAVVYINGLEVYRNNMPSGTIYYNTLAPTYIDGANEYTYVITNLSASALVDGNNVIAVEIHQNARTSSDISFNLKLKTLSGAKIMHGPATNDSIQQNSIPDNMVEMIVYPNPNTGKFNLEFCIDEIQQNPVIIEITNAFGQVVYNKIPQKINGCINETIELESDLPTGIYILKVSIDGKTQTAKMLLTR